MKLLVTGGTGSFGKAFVKHLSEHIDMDIVVFSRGEHAQHGMAKEIDSERVTYVLGDINNKRILSRALEGVSTVVNAAAQKHVPACESSPEQAIETNVFGTMNLVNLCRERNIKKLIHLSTDKAVQPINLYGFTKALAERYVLNSGYSAVRYGNVVNSNGAIIHHWRKLHREGKPLPVTDIRMTRFWMTIDDAIEIVLSTIMREPGLRVAREMPTFRIVDLAEAIAGPNGYYISGRRKGEKLHEKIYTGYEAGDPDLDGLSSNTYPDSHLTVDELKERLEKL